MAQRLIWHVGLMKSGTTYLQRRMEATSDALLEQGYLFPRPWRRQIAAVSDLLQRRNLDPCNLGAWDALRARIEAHPGTALISMELLAGASPKGIRRVAEAIPDAENLVVLTVRDLGRNVPAMWQESLKNQGTRSWAEYVESVRTREEAGRRFWRQQNLGAILGRWLEVFPSESVTVVTVPPPHASDSILWERFCRATGLRPDGPECCAQRNASLGVASALLVREVNLLFPDMPRRDHQRLVKWLLANRVLGSLREYDDRIGFEVPGWLRARAADAQRALLDSRVRVVGDVAELDPRDVPGADPDAVPPERIKELAIRGLAGYLRLAQPRPARHRPREAVLSGGRMG